ncbi:hypothetical protein, partial [Methylobacterium gnaphalii]
TLLDLPAEQNFTALQQLSSTVGDSWTSHPSFSAMLTMHNADELFRKLERDKHSDPDRATTPLLVPVGTWSGDRTAILGQDGHIFLAGGSNRLLEEHQREEGDPRPRAFADQWLNLMRRRCSRVEASGARYVQLIIPDKLTVLPEHFPRSIRTPGTMLRLIEAGLQGDTRIEENYVSVRHALGAAPNRAATVLKTDSHLSAYGCWITFRAVLEHLSLPIGQPPEFNTIRMGSGDLAMRFFGIPIVDTRLHADLPVLDAEFRSHGARIFHEHPSGRHVGSAESWFNPRAPIAATVLVIGNSYCGLENGQQGQLSWWFARWFRTYHFVWQSHLPLSLVEKLKPDIVVCQTVERFLIESPHS